METEQQQQTAAPVVIKVHEVLAEEAEEFEADTGITFAEGLFLVQMHRLSTKAAHAFLKMARKRPGGDHLPAARTYLELLNLFDPEAGRVVVDFGDPKGEPPS